MSEMQPAASSPRNLLRPKAPPDAAWSALASHRSLPPRDPLIDVIVPVYRGYDDTLACIHSVLASDNTTAYELVVINDASPEPNLVSTLDAIVAQGLIRLIHNDTNQGFVRSVAAAIALHPQRDVILLNSDTIVYGNWIDRLRAHRLDKKKIGTITPWSNNATILSYPVTLANNDHALEIDFDALDRLAAAELAGETCEIPTGVGFCFYVSRACMDDIGAFNASAFGRGYGEENDFCLRATARGWRNVAACDVFVRHTGEVSFQDDGTDARRLASAALLKLHPGYNDLIASFISADPLRLHRQCLDLARLKRWGGERLLLIFGNDPGRAHHRVVEGATSITSHAGRRAVYAGPSRGDPNAWSCIRLLICLCPICRYCRPGMSRPPCMRLPLWALPTQSSTPLRATLQDKRGSLTRSATS
jgi:GT2 family glycosyltransferase